MELKQEIIEYWTSRAKDFSNLHQRELEDIKSGRWLVEISPYLQNKHQKILDIGTGSGFFAILLSTQGYEVTGIDLCEEMIECAINNAKTVGTDVNFMVEDAENPDFEDESFDIIVTRNLTWTLPNMEKAYEKWHKILKKCGVLINLDGNYNANKLLETPIPKKCSHSILSDEQKKKCNKIYSELEKRVRPAYDVEVLKNIGYTVCEVDESLSDRIYKERDEFYNPVRMFKIVAKK